LANDFSRNNEFIKTVLEETKE